jgi:hypothetical protein
MLMDLRAPTTLGLFVAASMTAGVGLFPESARADWRVLESNTPSYAVDMLLPDSVQLKLGEGCYVRALQTQTNETRLFEGPHSAELPIAGTRDQVRLPPC